MNFWELNLVVNGNTIPTEITLKYLGVKLDKTLNFKQYLEGTS